MFREYMFEQYVRSKSAILVVAGAMVLAAGLPHTASALESTGWDHSILLYLMGPSIEGEVGVGPITGDVDLDPSDVLENLEFGAMVGYRAQKERWSVLVDLIYMDLAQGGMGDRGLATAEVGFDQLTLGFSGGYAIGRGTDVLFGVRWFDVSGDIRLESPINSQRADFGDDWLDPLVGLRWEAPLGERWRFVGLGDVGGFGVGSDFTWQVSLSFHARISKSISALLGYRHLDIDRESGSGPDRFLMKVSESGPAVGLKIGF